MSGTVTKESIRLIAKQHQIPSVKEEVTAALAPDAEYRIREIIQEATKFMRHSKRGILTTEDVNHALKLRNVEPIYGVQSRDDSHGDPDREVDFNEIINAQMPRIPRDCTMSLHWLAVEGVQPNIPQNPPSDQAELSMKKILKNSSGKTLVKPLVKDVLSKELQNYYERFTKAMQDREDDSEVDKFLSDLSTDPSLAQLLPYFVEFISDEVTASLDSLKILRRMLNIIYVLIHSPYLFVEPYLHQLMPPTLTCLLGKSLGKEDEESSDEQWSLRQQAASILQQMCRRYGDAYRSLIPRVTKTLLKAFLDPQKPLTTHFGSIEGICALGSQTIELIILPNLPSYLQGLEEHLTASNSSKQIQARKCMDALLVRLF
eukprot:TRINITY_DN2517_c0_g1_i1.p1 TRINITY_DN2517_c0_g1~~TRINITY_DN2517_c0_g1_i1.p1  ORF type:complete len:374 (+),score=61.38 TRINITY_DN2517_c0_g1_i1:23-1144(+)